jgi:hypothetical protein
MGNKVSRDTPGSTSRYLSWCVQLRYRVLPCRCFPQSGGLRAYHDISRHNRACGREVLTTPSAFASAGQRCRPRDVFMTSCSSGNHFWHNRWRCVYKLLSYQYATISTFFEPFRSRSQENSIVRVIIYMPLPRRNAAEDLGLVPSLGSQGWSLAFRCESASSNAKQKSA